MNIPFQMRPIYNLLTNVKILRRAQFFAWILHSLP